ncbi:protein kilB [Streptomyces sp. NPDC051555]|uniref:protein kilB n=1 Tax=Streptomyces sp. NPDC051555 TaxID=3365657 RepID=UPI00378876DA
MGEISGAGIALAGTLLGGLMAWWGQTRQARVQRQQAIVNRGLAALADLAAALADHRRAMWLREDLRLSGAPAEQVAAARSASHVTRSAVTAPQVSVAVLMPGLRDRADAAVRAAYALRGAPSLPEVNQLRDAAVDAVDAMVGAAARLLTT